MPPLESLVSVADLWAPILVAAVAVFFVSSILHMVIPIHKGDMKKMPGEEQVLEQMRTQGLQPGSYMFPAADSMKDMGNPEMIEKYKRGPVGFMTVVPTGAPAIGKGLVQWFVYSLVISFFVAYIGTMALPVGAEFRQVFRLVGTVAILAYALADVPASIWKGQPWIITAKFVFDGVLYGLATGIVFGWLWPNAA